MVAEIKPTAELVGAHAEYAKAAAYVTGLDLLPLARVVDDTKVTDHHAIIPTRAEHPSRRWTTTTGASTTSSCGAFSRSSTPRPCSRTRASRRRSPTMRRRRRGGTCSARAAGSCSCRAGAGCMARRPASARPEGRGGRGRRPAAAAPRAGRAGRDAGEVESARKETKPPRRYSDASLLGAMETAGKLVEDDELREAMKDSGIGTPGDARGDHRAADRRSATSSATDARWSRPRRAAA